PEPPDAQAARRAPGRAAGRRDDLVRDRPARFEKSVLKPWLTTRWCIPPERNAAFVCQMEEVLDIYERPYDPRFPQVCFDEASKQLVGEVTAPVPVAPGQPAREDYEYVRNGVANLFMLTEPLRGGRH